LPPSPVRPLATTIAGLPSDVVSAALVGDPAAVSELFGCLRPVLVRYCRARITAAAPHGGADDVAQDICVAILRGLPTFTSEPHTLMPWVYGIAAHKVVDHYHRGARDRTVPTENVPTQQDPSPGPEELAVRGEQRAVVQSLLARLNPVQREVVILRLFRGLSSAEVSAITGLSTTAVRATPPRAVHRLRRHVLPRRPVPG
jgi:RNA polymerase sigma-70 factor, ECF subfamily